MSKNTLRSAGGGEKLAASESVGEEVPSLDPNDTHGVATAATKCMPSERRQHFLSHTPTFADWTDIRRRIRKQYGTKVAMSRLKRAYPLILATLSTQAQAQSGMELKVVTEITDELKSAVRELLLEDPRRTPGELPPLLLERYSLKCNWRLVGKASRCVYDEDRALQQQGTSGSSSGSHDDSRVAVPVVGGRIRLRVESPNKAGKLVWRSGTITAIDHASEVDGNGAGGSRSGGGFEASAGGSSQSRTSSSGDGTSHTKYTIQMDDESIGTLEAVDLSKLHFEVLDENQLGGHKKLLTSSIEPLTMSVLATAEAADIGDDSVWQTVSGIVPSNDGMNGVIFVKTHAGIIVLKASANAVNEVFGSHLAEFAGLPSAKLRVVVRADPLFSVIKNAVRAVTATEHLPKVHRTFQFHHLLLFEFVQASRNLDDPCLDAAATLDVSSAAGRKRLHQMGELSALDTLLHNVDRIPVVCNNNGNAGNVMFSMGGYGDGAQVVAIDQCLNPIDPIVHPSHLQLYVQDCVDFMQSALWFTNNKKGRLVGRRRCMCTPRPPCDHDDSSMRTPSKQMTALAETLQSEYGISETEAMAAVNKRPAHSKAMLFFHYPFLKSYLKTCMAEEQKLGHQPLGIIIRFRDFVALSTQFDVGHSGCLEFCKGIVVGGTKLAALSEAKLQAIQRDVRAAMKLDQEAHQAQEATARQYLRDVIAAFRLGLSGDPTGGGPPPVPPPRGIKRGDVPTSTKSEENPTDTQLPDILKPPQGRQTTVDGNAAVAAVETAFDQRIVDSERRSSASAVASEEMMQQAVLLSLFEILRWGEDGLPAGTFNTLLHDRRLNPAGRDKHNRSLLMVAAKQNQAPMLQKLIATFGCRPYLSMVDDAGNNALHFACMYGCAESAHVILAAAAAFDNAQAGAEGSPSAASSMVNQLFRSNEHGYTPEAIALKEGFGEMFRMLFREKHGFDADSEVFQQRLPDKEKNLEELAKVNVNERSKKLAKRLTSTKLKQLSPSP